MSVNRRNPVTIMRRDFVLAAAVSGFSAVFASPSKALAIVSPPPRLPGNTPGLPDINGKFWFENACDPDAKATIKAHASKIVEAIGRILTFLSDGILTPRGISSVVTVTVRKDADGQLLVESYIVDDNGNRVAPHKGKAPHHTHPAMRAHLEQVFGKANVWLTQHGR